MTSLSTPAPKVSVVVCVLDMERLLARQLECLLTQETTFPFEVVVVDNGSADRSREVAEAFALSDQRIRVHDARPRGLNVARNVGVQESRSEVIAMCDADDEVQPGWLSALEAAYRSDCYIGGALLSAGTNDPVVRRRWGVDGESPKVPRFTLDGVATPAGGNCCFGKTMWLDLGGFDERLSGAGDETEFFARAGRAGCHYVTAPGAVVHYRFPDSALAVWKRGYRYGIHVGVNRRPAAAFDVGQRRLLVKKWLWLVLELPRVIVRRRGIYRWLDKAGKRVGEAIAVASQRWERLRRK